MLGTIHLLGFVFFELHLTLLVVRRKQTPQASSSAWASVFRPMVHTNNRATCRASNSNHQVPPQEAKHPTETAVQLVIDPKVDVAKDEAAAVATTNILRAEEEAEAM